MQDCIIKNNEMKDGHFNITKLEETIYLWCADKGIKTVHENALIFEYNQSINIYLYNNSITSIPVNFFNGLNQAILIDLSNNLLTSFESHLFSNNINIKIINMRSNKIGSLNDDHFKFNHKIENISLSINNISTIDEDTFKNNVLLKYLGLDDNLLKVLHKDLLKSNTELVYVNLEKNNISFLHRETFKNNIKLQNLYLSDNMLEVISNDTFQYNINLIVLSLKNNAITNIAGSWQQLTKLKRLVLYNNKLTELNENIFKLKSLENLYVHANEFECGCEMEWTLTFNYDKLTDYTKRNVFTKCNRVDNGSIFTIYDFIVEDRDQHKDALSFLRNLNCQNGYLNFLKVNKLISIRYINAYPMLYIYYDLMNSNNKIYLH